MSWADLEMARPRFQRKKHRAGDETGAPRPSSRRLTTNSAHASSSGVGIDTKDTRSPEDRLVPHDSM